MFYTRWTESEKITDEDFKDELIIFAELCESYRPKGWTIANIQYTIPPDVQVWIAEEIIPRTMVTSNEKAAFMIPEDVFVKMSIEQIADENLERNGTKDLNRFFSNIYEAKRWLLS